MFRNTRVVLAAILAVAVAAVPLMMDQCRATCEAPARIATTPACHHTGTATAFHLGQAPSSCGHDHNGTLVIAGNGLTAPSRPLVASIAAVAVYADPAVPHQHLRTHAPPGTASTLLGRSSLPLRI